MIMTCEISYTSSIIIDNHLSAKLDFNNIISQITFATPKHKLQFKTLLQISFHIDSESKGSK